MPINPLQDTLQPLAALARQLPHAPSPATVWRWHSRGILGIRLEIVRIGGRVYSTENALAEFIRATTEAKAAGCPPEADSRSTATAERLRKARLLAE